MKVHLKTLGCRLNQSEIDSMARQFTRQGHDVIESPEGADLFVVNTCAVTQEATRSSRQLIYRLHRASPEAKIAVTGCYAHIAPQEIQTLSGVSDVVTVVNNFDKSGLVSIATGEPIAESEVYDLEPIERQKLVGSLGKTRAFIKVQDGCDRKCSFCVTRIARGPGRSRNLTEIVQEVQAMAALGYAEAVLTGVHLGSYGEDLGQADGLYQLIQTLLTDTDMPRIRLSSLEPWGIRSGFFELWQNPRLGRHLHLPLQSGCDATLRRMIRRTSQAEFRQIMDEARQHVPEMAIATDVIVGFPGETEEEFAVSRAFIEEMDFAGIHVFRYSKRPGTAATRLPDHISEDVKKQRSDILQQISRDGEQRFAERFIGRRLPVLWEAISGSNDSGFLNNGYTDNFLRVVSTVPEILTDQIVPTRLERYDPERGVLVGSVEYPVAVD